MPAACRAPFEELVAGANAQFGISCTFKCDKAVRVTKNETATHLYRIAQEALTNAVKHGRAKNIRVILASQKGQIYP